jgi:hypothetical protein
MIAKLIQFALIMILLVLVVTQMTIPALKNQPIFPIFRKRKKLEDELSILNEMEEDEKIAKKIAVKSKKMKGNK